MKMYLKVLVGRLKELKWKLALKNFIFFIYIRDIPYAISGNYTVVVGQCSSIPIYFKDPHLSITIDNTLLSTSLNYKKIITVGNTYRIEYLPHSKEVINVYRRVVH